MIKYEIKKMMSLPHILLILLAFIIQFILCFYPQNVSHTYSKTVYKDYTEKLSGEYTADKRAYIEKEYERMQDVIEKYEETSENYKKEIITLEEYEKYNDSYNEAMAKISTVEYLIEKCNYFDKIGNKCYFFYDTDWDDFLSESGIDYISAILIILMITTVFSDEYSSKSRNIILTTYKGKTHTAISKLCLSFAFAFIISACMGAVRYLVFIFHNGESGNMGIRNLIDYGGFSELSITKYYVAEILLHSIIWSVCALFICLISNLTKNGIFTVFISFVAIVCVALLNTDSLRIFDFIFSGKLLSDNLNKIFGSGSLKYYIIFPCTMLIKTFAYASLCVVTWKRKNR